MADADIARLNFEVNNTEGLKRIQEIDRSLRNAGYATQDFYSKVKLLGNALISFKAFDNLAKTSNNLQQSAKRLATSLTTSNANAKEFALNIRNWVNGFATLEPKIGATVKTLRELEKEFTMTRSQAVATIGEITSSLRTSFDSSAMETIISFLPQATQNWAAYLGRIEEAKQIQEAFIRALATGMTRGLTRFGIQIETQSEDFKALAEHIQQTTGATNEYAKRLAVMQKLMEQTSKAEGAFTEQSSSLANQWESLKNNLKEIKDMVADMLGKSIEPIVRAINNVLTPFVKNMLAGLATSVGRILFVKITFTSIGNLIKIATNNIVEFGTKIGEAGNNTAALQQKLSELNAKKIKNDVSLNDAVHIHKKQVEFLKKYVTNEEEYAKARKALDKSYTKYRINDMLMKGQKELVNFEIKLNKFKNNLNKFTSATLAVSTVLSLIPAKADSAGEKIKEFAGNAMTAVYALNLLVSAIPVSLAKKISDFFKTTAGIAVSSYSIIAFGIASAVVAIEQHIHDLMNLLMKFEPIKKMLESQGWLMKWLSGMSLSEKIAEKIRGIWSNTAEEVVKESQKAQAEVEKTAEIQKEALTNQINALTEKAKTFFNSINDELQQLINGANEVRNTSQRAINANSVEALEYRSMQADNLAIEIYKKAAERADKKSAEISMKLTSLKGVLEAIEKKIPKEPTYNEYTFQN